MTIDRSNQPQIPSQGRQEVRLSPCGRSPGLGRGHSGRGFRGVAAVHVWTRCQICNGPGKCKGGSREQVSNGPTAEDFHRLDTRFKPV